MSRLEKMRTLNSLLLKEAPEDSQCCVVSGPAFAAVSQRNSDIRIFALETAVSRFSDVMRVMHMARISAFGLAPADWLIMLSSYDGKGVYRRMNQIMDLFLTFGRIGAFTFGGGYAMLSLLDYECVEKKKWLTADELMDVTVIAESTPGPIAINCATYTGYKLAGMRGAFFATVGMVLPSFLLFLAVSAFFENMLVVGMIEKAFRGIRIAVSILIIQAADRMIRKMMKKSPDRKAQIFLVIFFFLAALAMNIAGMHISTVYFIICSGFIGLALFGRSGNKKAGRDDL